MGREEEPRTGIAAAAGAGGQGWGWCGTFRRRHRQRGVAGGGLRGGAWWWRPHRRRCRPGRGAEGEERLRSRGRRRGLGWSCTRRWPLRWRRRAAAGLCVGECRGKGTGCCFFFFITGCCFSFFFIWAPLGPRHERLVSVAGICYQLMGSDGYQRVTVDEQDFMRGKRKELFICRIDHQK